MEKVGVLIFVSLLFISFAFAQSDLIDASGFGDEVDKVKNVTDKVQEFSAEEDKLSYLGERWLEILLNNKFISAVDGFFNDINIVFVILFGMDYAFSMMMFFVFLIWIFFFLSFREYVFFSSNQWIKLVVAFIGAVVFAQANVFLYISGIMFKVLFYKSGALWTFFSYLFIFVVFAVFLLVNKFFGKKLKALKRLKRMKKSELERKEFSEVVKGIKKGAESN